MKRYRKKPVVIEAMEWDGDIRSGNHPLTQWLLDNDGDYTYTNGHPQKLAIVTLEGDMTAEPGDFIIKGVKGEFYPCKPDIFAATYEEVE